MNTAPMPRIYCDDCGKSVEAACDCGVNYITAAQRAENALAENPDLSDRAIALKAGVSDTTVFRARQKPTASREAAARLGLDGRWRILPPPLPPGPPTATVRTVSIIRAFAKFCAENSVPDCAAFIQDEDIADVKGAVRTIDMWLSQLSITLQRRTQKKPDMEKAG
jgi:hypothetical protein